MCIFRGGIGPNRLAGAVGGWCRVDSQQPSLLSLLPLPKPTLTSHTSRRTRVMSTTWSPMLSGRSSAPSMATREHTRPPQLHPTRNNAVGVVWGFLNKHFQPLPGKPAVCHAARCVGEGARGLHSPHVFCGTAYGCVRWRRLGHSRQPSPSSSAIHVWVLVGCCSRCGRVESAAHMCGGLHARVSGPVRARAHPRLPPCHNPPHSRQTDTCHTQRPNATCCTPHTGAPVVVCTPCQSPIHPLTAPFPLPHHSRACGLCRACTDSLVCVCVCV